MIDLLAEVVPPVHLNSLLQASGKEECNQQLLNVVVTLVFPWTDGVLCVSITEPTVVEGSVSLALAIGSRGMREAGWWILQHGSHRGRSEQILSDKLCSLSMFTSAVML